MEQSQAITVTQEDSFLAPVAGIAQFLSAYQAKKDFIDAILKPELDYGPIPGSDKPALKKPGAEKLSNLFGLIPAFEDVATTEDWTGAEHDGEPFFYYRQKCNLSKHGSLVASADGSCNSWEKKYRYRSGERVCPNCGKPSIIKGKLEYGGGWICFTKKGGCGGKFRDNDPAITDQQTGQVKNPDVAELVNTVLKMAQKRALVAAVLIATSASDYFTQDIEDFTDVAWKPESVVSQPTEQPKSNGKQRGEAEILDELGFQMEPTDEEIPPTVPQNTRMSLETAEKIMSASAKKPYGELTNDELSHHFIGIATALKRNNLTPERRDDLLFKQDAITVILKHREQK